MKNKFALPILFLTLALLFTGVSVVSASEMKYSERGRYIYDEANRLPLESELSLNSYLWKLDVRTDYEIVIIFPEEKLDEERIIGQFNEMGIGKKERDTGTGIFIFSDNSVFVAIGSGNDRVSVAAAMTDGGVILKNLDKDPVLSILRFVNALAGEISDPVTSEKGGGLGETVKDNLNLIFLWASVLSLIVFLIQQIDGFQPRDLVLPIILFILAGIFVGISIAGGSGESAYTKEYGVITATQHDTRHWVQVVVVSNGKSTTTYTIPHTDYINHVSFLSYNLKPYRYTFETTDYQGAWEHGEGELDALTVKIKDGRLAGADSFNDRSGGKTIGDGVWIIR